MQRKSARKLEEYKRKWQVDPMQRTELQQFYLGDLTRRENALAKTAVIYEKTCDATQCVANSYA